MPRRAVAWQGLWGIILVLAVWQGLAWLVAQPVLPGPAAALRAFAASLKEGNLPLHFAYSAYRVVVALGFGLLLAVPAGMVMGRHRLADALFSPFVHLIYPVPKVAFLPVVVILLGIQNLSKIFLIGLIVFFQILVTTRDAARGVNRASITSIESLGASEWDVYRHVVFPACLPKVFTSLRISVGTAIAVLFLTETFATTWGLGYYLLDTWSRLNYENLFAGVIAMGLLGAGLYWLLDRVEAWFCPWERL